MKAKLLVLPESEAKNYYSMKNQRMSYISIKKWITNVNRLRFWWKLPRHSKIHWLDKQKKVVRIKNRSQKETLNSKSQFNHPPILRISVEGKKISFKNKKICYSGWGWTSWKTNGNGTEDILLFWTLFELLRFTQQWPGESPRKCYVDLRILSSLISVQ